MPGLTAAGWFDQTGFEESEAGWQAYRNHLIVLANNLEEQKRLGWDGFSHGWALGSASWKKALAEEHKNHVLAQGLERSVIRELKLAKWNAALEKALVENSTTKEALLQGPKGAPWKIKLACDLRSQEGASIAWLCEALNLGAQGGARALLSRWKKNQQSAA
jgi:hypothetical protein